MGQEGVGAPLERAQVEERQPVGGGRIAQVARKAVERARTVLALQVLRQSDALRRDGRVQLERGEAPAQAGGLVTERVQCFEPARRADVAPRSDDVGPDDDVDHVLSPREL
jgi:hypothetical protein